MVFQNFHSVVDGNYPDQAARSLYHRCGNHVVLVKRIGHIFFGLIHRNNAEILVRQIQQHHLARRAHDPTKWNRANWMHGGINHNYIIEILRQIFAGAHIVNRIADVPVIGGQNHLALHKTASGVVFVLQRLFNCDTIRVIERAKQSFLLWRIQILDQINNVIGIKVFDHLGQDRIRRVSHDFVAHAFFKLGQNLAVNVVTPKADKTTAVLFPDLLQKVGDIGFVQVFEQQQQRRLRTLVHCSQHRVNQAGTQRVYVFVFADGIIGHTIPLLSVGHRAMPRYRISCVL